jgi:hypothetical protein
MHPLRTSVKPAAAPLEVRVRPSTRPGHGPSARSSTQTKQQPALGSLLRKLWPVWLLLAVLALPYVMNMLSGSANNNQLKFDCPGAPAEMPAHMSGQTTCQPRPDCHCVDAEHCSWRWVCEKPEL